MIQEQKEVTIVYNNHHNTRKIHDILKYHNTHEICEMGHRYNNFEVQATSRKRILFVNDDADTTVKLFTY